MTETVWEQIQAKSTKAKSLEALYDKTKKDFESDGVITNTEREGLEKIDKGIKMAKAKVKELEAEFLENKKKWEGRAKDLSKVKKQYDDLSDWNGEAAVLEDIDGFIIDAGDNAKAMAWLDAIEQLDYAIAYTEAPYKEYTKQLPFRDDYNRDYPKLRDRSEKLYEHEFYELESITHSLERYQHQRESAEGAAGEFRYDDACRYLNDAKETLDDIDKDIADLTAKEEKCTAEMNSLLADASIYAKSEFDSVQEMNEAFEGARNGLQEMLDDWKFDEALADFKVARKMIAVMKAKHEREEARGGATEVEDADAEFLKNKKKWEERAKDLSKVKKHYDELVDWNDETAVLEEIDSFIIDAGDYAEAMKWLDAIEQLDYAIAYTEAPYNEYIKQLPFRDDYNRDFPKLTDRSEKLHDHEFYELESINHSYAVYESQMESAVGAAGDLRYDDACRYLNDAKETLDDMDKDIANLTAKEEKCAAEMNSLLADASIYAKSEFDSVQEMNEAFEGARNGLQEMLDDWKFDEALADLKIARKIVDEMKAKQEGKDSEKTEYEKKEGVLSDCTKKIGEVTGATFDVSKTVAKTASSLMRAATGIATDAAKQDWAGASDKIDDLKTEAEALYESFGDEKSKAEEMKKWDDLLPTVSEVKEQVSLLIDWGVDAAKDVQNGVEDAVKRAAEDKYVDAVALIEGAKKDLGPLLKDLDKEQRSELIYRGLRAAFDAQMEVIRESRFAANQAVKLILDQVSKIVEPIGDHVAGNKFDLATEVITEARDPLQTAVKELERLTGVQTMAMNALNAAKNKLEQTGDLIFDSLKTIRDAVTDGTEEIENLISEIDSADDALEKAKTLTGKVDEYAYKVAELAKDKAGWEKKKKDLAAVEKAIEDLQSAGSNAVKGLKDTATKIFDDVVAEKWAEATAQIVILKERADAAMEEEEEALQMAQPDPSGGQSSLAEEEEELQM
jgi:hypothetical protein